jgi:hypothetical protein
MHIKYSQQSDSNPAGNYTGDNRLDWVDSVVVWLAQAEEVKSAGALPKGKEIDESITWDLSGRRSMQKEAHELMRRTFATFIKKTATKVSYRL